MLDAYRKHEQERLDQGIPPLPLNAEQVAELVELLKNPPAGEEGSLVDLITNRVPPGVDEAAYVKAGFLSAIAKGETECALIDRSQAVDLLGNMHGGYNIETLVGLLPDADLDIAARRIAWGKCTNAGQTCIAPDYVLTDATTMRELVPRLRHCIDEMYGDDPMQSPDYGRIVNDGHFERITGLLEGERPVCGGSFDRDESRRRTRRSPARISAPAATPPPWLRSCLPGREYRADETFAHRPSESTVGPPVAVRTFS